jgi:hypothetical protein
MTAWGDGLTVLVVAVAWSLISVAVVAVASRFWK